MRLHLLHIAKFAALVALAGVITYTLGSHTQGSHEHARQVARAAESGVRPQTGGIPFVKVSADMVNLERAAGIGNGSCHADGAERLAAGDHAARKFAAEPDGGIISSIAEELKSTVTLLRAYSLWIRTSPDSTANPIG
ncbi:MAG TPA: hypothetical protein VM182_06595 [Terriglobia bacterium]|nr:hypothetical protein [Terriglobia bacterium]